VCRQHNLKIHSNGVESEDNLLRNVDSYHLRFTVSVLESFMAFSLVFLLHLNQGIPEEITRRFNSRNACYHSVQNLLSSRLQSKKLKIRIYKIIMLPMVLYGCETWSLTLREEHRLGVFENRVRRGMR
jgi:hexokinase